MTTKAGSLQSQKMRPLLARSEFMPLPTAAHDDDLKTVTTISALTLEITTFTLQPSYARNVVITIVDSGSALTGGTFTVTGIDQNGKPVQETFTYTVAGAYTGDVAFSVLESLQFALTGALGGTQTVVIGSGTKHGLPVGIDGVLVDVYKASHNGAPEAVGVVDKVYATVIPTSASAGNYSQEFWYTYMADIGGNQPGW